MINFIWSFSKSIDPLDTHNLFATFCLMRVQESVGIVYTCTTFKVFVHIHV